MCADGSVLEYSTYLELSLGAHASAIKVAASGAAIVTGETYAGDFPTTPGALNETGLGSADAFVTRLDPSGGSLEWSTLLGGIGGVDRPLDMALDNQENVILAGYSGFDWPISQGAFQTQWAGQWDGFITKISSDGSSLLWSTWLGGSAIEQAYGVDICPAETWSFAAGRNRLNFPLHRTHSSLPSEEVCTMEMRSSYVWMLGDRYLSTQRIWAVAAMMGQESFTSMPQES